MSQKKQVKITFAPGCFDNFDGDQAELDEFVTEIQRLVETGEIFEKGREIDLDEMLDDPEERDLAIKLLQSLDSGTNRNLQ